MYHNTLIPSHYLTAVSLGGDPLGSNVVVLGGGISVIPPPTTHTHTHKILIFKFFIIFMIGEGSDV